MQILVNGQPQPVSEGAELVALLSSLKLGERRVAVELNGQIVPRSAWGETHLADGDHLEIVHAIGGG